MTLPLRRCIPLPHVTRPRHRYRAFDPSLCAWPPVDRSGRSLAGGAPDILAVARGRGTALMKHLPARFASSSASRPRRFARARRPRQPRTMEPIKMNQTLLEKFENHCGLKTSIHCSLRGLSERYDPKRAPPLLRSGNDLRRISAISPSKLAAPPMG